MSHTPGPWRLHANEIVGAEGTPNAWVVAKMAYGAVSQAPVFSWLNPDHYHAHEVTQANARLIAAAPDLLEALKTLCDANIPDGFTPIAGDPTDTMWANARAAIAKATGETQ